MSENDESRNRLMSLLTNIKVIKKEASAPTSSLAKPTEHIDPQAASVAKSKSRNNTSTSSRQRNKSLVESQKKKDIVDINSTHHSADNPASQVKKKSNEKAKKFEKMPTKSNAGSGNDNIAITHEPKIQPIKPKPGVVDITKASESSFCGVVAIEPLTNNTSVLQSTFAPAAITTTGLMPIPFEENNNFIDENKRDKDLLRADTVGETLPFSFIQSVSLSPPTTSAAAASVTAAVHVKNHEGNNDNISLDTDGSVQQEEVGQLSESKTNEEVTMQQQDIVTEHLQQSPTPPTAVSSLNLLSTEELQRLRQQQEHQHQHFMRHYPSQQQQQVPLPFPPPYGYPLPLSPFDHPFNSSGDVSGDRHMLMPGPVSVSYGMPPPLGMMPLPLPQSVFGTASGSNSSLVDNVRGPNVTSPVPSSTSIRSVSDHDVQQKQQQDEQALSEEQQNRQFHMEQQYRQHQFYLYQQQQHDYFNRQQPFSPFPLPMPLPLPVPHHSHPMPPQPQSQRSIDNVGTDDSQPQHDEQMLPSPQQLMQLQQYQEHQHQLIMMHQHQMQMQQQQIHQQPPPLRTTDAPVPLAQLQSQLAHQQHQHQQQSQLPPSPLLPPHINPNSNNMLPPDIAAAYHQHVQQMRLQQQQQQFHHEQQHQYHQHMLQQQQHHHQLQLLRHQQQQQQQLQRDSLVSSPHSSLSTPSTTAAVETSADSHTHHLSNMQDFQNNFMVNNRTENIENDINSDSIATNNNNHDHINSHQSHEKNHNNSIVSNSGSGGSTTEPVNSSSNNNSARVNHKRSHDETETEENDHDNNNNNNKHINKNKSNMNLTDNHRHGSSTSMDKNDVKEEIKDNGEEDDMMKPPPGFKTPASNNNGSNSSNNSGNSSGNNNHTAVLSSSINISPKKDSVGVGAAVVVTKSRFFNIDNTTNADQTQKQLQQQQPSTATENNKKAHIEEVDEDISDTPPPLRMRTMEDTLLLSPPLIVSSTAATTDARNTGANVMLPPSSSSSQSLLQSPGSQFNFISNYSNHHNTTTDAVESLSLMPPLSFLSNSPLRTVNNTSITNASSSISTNVGGIVSKADINDENDDDDEDLEDLIAEFTRRNAIARSSNNSHNSGSVGDDIFSTHNQPQQLGSSSSLFGGGGSGSSGVSSHNNSSGGFSVTGQLLAQMPRDSMNKIPVVMSSTGNNNNHNINHSNQQNSHHHNINQQQHTVHTNNTNTITSAAVVQQAASPTPVPALTAAAAVPPPVNYMRIVKHQPGLLHIYLPPKKRNNNNNNNKSSSSAASIQGKVFVEGFSVRPNDSMTVQWQLPLSLIQEAQRDSNHIKLSIGLVRYGAAFNHPNIIAKPIGPLHNNNRSLSVTKDELGNEVVVGSVEFFAPKGAGHFVYRLYDQSSTSSGGSGNNSNSNGSNSANNSAVTNSNKQLVTLATSLDFFVELLDTDVTTNLKFSAELFQQAQHAQNVHDSNSSATAAAAVATSAATIITPQKVKQNISSNADSSKKDPTSLLKGLLSISPSSNKDENNTATAVTNSNSNNSSAISNNNTNSNDSTYIDHLVNVSVSKGLNQLISTITSIRSSGRVMMSGSSGNTTDPKELLNYCLERVCYLIKESSNVLLTCANSAATQKEATITAMRSTSRAQSVVSPPPQTALASTTIVAETEGLRKPRSDTIESTAATTTTNNTTNNPVAAAIALKVKLLLRLQNDLYECLSAVAKNNLVVNMLYIPLRQLIQQHLHHFCPLLFQFYTRNQDVDMLRALEYGFTPTAPINITALKQQQLIQLQQLRLLHSQQHHNNNDQQNQQQHPFRFSNELPSTLIISSNNNSSSSIYTTTTMDMDKIPFEVMTHVIEEKLPTLIPPLHFSSDRASVCKRLEKILIDQKALPVGSVLILYGSSDNNFGTAEADLDMCILFPLHLKNIITVEMKPKILELIGTALMNNGMHDVEVRSTARVPIVTFKDSVSGLECDIGFYNSLALSNTRLLRTYSLCDSRVRPLAYVIKHWVKARQINCPAEGTLGSYGYILCLIHFLQTRPIPVLPNLQNLPPDWRGENNINNSSGINIISNASPSTSSFKSHEIELHPVDNTPCNTYFYSPVPSAASAAVGASGAVALRREDFKYLHEFGSRNKETLSELLLGFFQYYAWEFDFKHQVVSIQHVNNTGNNSNAGMSGNNTSVTAAGVQSKIQKAEVCAWNAHNRLSIEDPFELHYDIAHVIKGPQMIYIRREFLRAYTIMRRAADSSSVALPTASAPLSSVSEGILNNNNTDEGGEILVPSTIHPRQFIDILCQPPVTPPPFSAAGKLIRKQRANTLTEGLLLDAEASSLLLDGGE